MSFDLDTNQIVKQGWLEKKSKYLGVWRARWFVLTREYLFIYNEKSTKEKAKTIISLSSISVTSSSDTIFKIECEESYLLKTSTVNEKQEWIDAVKKYTRECIKLPIVVECPRDHDFNDNFELVVPYDTQYPYSINTLMAEIIDYKHKKHKPFKFIASKISYSKVSKLFKWSGIDTFITDFDKNTLQRAGMHLEIDISIYEHNILSVLCENMKNNDRLCPIYLKMRYQDIFTEKYLDHLLAYDHADNAECKYGDECYSYKRLQMGGNELKDRCHAAIFKHPPRRRKQRIVPKDVRAFTFNDEWSLNVPLLNVNVEEEIKCDQNHQDVFLQFLIQEVITNGYKSALHLNEEDENSLMNIVQQKLKSTRHKLMGSPLNKAEMLSIVLYTGCDCNYDLCAAQNNGDYKKWKYFDYFLYHAITKLSKREHGSYKIYTGFSSTQFAEKYVECGYFKTYVSTSWNKKVAETFVDDKGMIFEMDKRFRENAICCDVSWISKFPDECEILIARSIDAICNCFTGQIIDDQNGIQFVSLRLFGDTKQKPKQHNIEPINDTEADKKEQSELYSIVTQVTEETKEKPKTITLDIALNDKSPRQTEDMNHSQSIIEEQKNQSKSNELSSYSHFKPIPNNLSSSTPFSLNSSDIVSSTSSTDEDNKFTERFSDDTIFSESNMISSEIFDELTPSTNHDSLAIQETINSIETGLNIITTWDKMFASYYNENGAITLPLAGGDQPLKHLYGNQGDKSNEDEANRDKNHGDHSSNNNGNGNHHNNNDGNKKKENITEATEEDYDCNKPWHKKRIKELECKVYVQNQTIAQLEAKLQHQVEFNSLTAIDRALGGYYERLFIVDYFIDGHGRFLQYVLDQNLNHKVLSLSKVLNKDFDTSNSIYAQFDPEFPFSNFIEKEAMCDGEKAKVIFGIIQYCYRNNSPPSDQYIKQHICPDQYQKSPSTVMDGLSQQIKGKKHIKQIKRMLDLEEYDSDALAMDISITEKANSNVGQLLTCDSKYILMQQYMDINTKSDNTSCRAVRPEISVQLIQQTIPTIIEEKFINIVNYMDRYILLHGTNAMIECNHGNNLVIDFNFHSKDEYKYESEKKKISSYVICEKNKSSGEWKMTELSTWQQIQHIFNVSNTEKPKPMKMQSPLMQECVTKMRQITNLLRNQEQRIKLIEHKNTPWSRRDKIPVIGRKSKYDQAKSISLQLCRDQWVTIVSEFAEKNINNIKLVPIITSNKQKCGLDVVWIIEIDVGEKQSGNIGISLKVGKSYKKTECLMVSGIYLDINDEHRLVPYEKHDCKCLNDFIFNIYDLKIGNETNRMNQKYKTIQNKLNNAKKRIKQLEYQHKKSKILHLNLSKMKHIRLLSNSDVSKRRKQKVLNNAPNINTPNCDKQSFVNSNAPQNCEYMAFQKCKTLQKQLNDAQNHIMTLAFQCQKHTAFIYQTKNVFTQLEYQLNQAKSFLWSLSQKQQVLNNHQQMISSLNGKVISLSLSQWQQNTSTNVS